MTTIRPPYYTLPSSSLPWTTIQEKTISTDFPFDLTDETAEQYIARTYLQFLWLPEVLMPLGKFVPSLRRLTSSSTSSSSSISTSPDLHALLEPLLLTPRTAAGKYQTELPHLLAMGGGDGEMEETMMWFGLAHAHDPRGEEAVGEVWEDEKWRGRWLEKMERREVQLQILLYLLKLSLPPIPFKKRKREVSYEDRLEAFMDKLSTWQMLQGISSQEKEGRARGDTRDWMQVFWEGVVEPMFKDQLPELITSLRTKIFPVSLFSDSSRSPSPEPERKPPKRAMSISSTASRQRSLSVSLAQEREKEERVRAGDVGKKRVLNREVSMSRVFRPKAKPVRKERKEEKEKEEKGRTKKKDMGVTLVEETPQKGKGRDMFGGGEKEEKGKGMLFPTVSGKEELVAEETPVKPLGRTVSHPTLQPLFPMRRVGLFPSSSSSSLFESPMRVPDDEEVEWPPDSSPDLLLLHSGGSMRRSRSRSSTFGEDMSEDEGGGFNVTPSKPRRR